jgi:DNA-binding transcriptional ArsR family regulator
METLSALEKVFHEPSRLAILSELAARKEGKTFSELKQACGLTDGNLSRHLQTLKKAGIIKISKEFVNSKPCTTVIITRKGRKSFIDYLNELEAVVKKASARIHKL